MHQSIDTFYALSEYQTSRSTIHEQVNEHERLDGGKSDNVVLGERFRQGEMFGRGSSDAS